MFIVPERLTKRGLTSLLHKAHARVLEDTEHAPYFIITHDDGRELFEWRKEVRFDLAQAFGAVSHIYPGQGADLVADPDKRCWWCHAYVGTKHSYTVFAFVYRVIKARVGKGQLTGEQAQEIARSFRLNCAPMPDAMRNEAQQRSLEKFAMWRFDPPEYTRNQW